MESFLERKNRLAAEKAEEKRVKDIITKLKRKIRSDIIASGVQSIRYKVEYMKSNPNARTIGKEFSTERLVQIYNETIEQYLKSKK